MTESICSKFEEHQLGILSPYRSQVAAISNLKGFKNIVGTIDGFQGQEKEVIIINTVRANASAQIGFLKD